MLAPGRSTSYWYLLRCSQRNVDANMVIVAFGGFLLL